MARAGGQSATVLSFEAVNGVFFIRGQFDTVIEFPWQHCPFAIGHDDRI